MARSYEDPGWGRSRGLGGTERGWNERGGVAGANWMPTAPPLVRDVPRVRDAPDVAHLFGGGNNLSALGLAVLLRGLGVPLALAAVLSGAGVAVAVARPGPLARVDAVADDVVAGLGRRHAHCTRREHSGHRGGNHGSLDRHFLFS